MAKREKITAIVGGKETFMKAMNTIRKKLPHSFTMMESKKDIIIWDETVWDILSLKQGELILKRRKQGETK